MIVLSGRKILKGAPFDFDCMGLPPRYVENPQPVCECKYVVVTPGQSNGAADAQLAHARLQSSAFHSEQGSGAFRAGDAPFRLPQGPQNVLALGFF
jgi:hypothetical protein